MHTILSNHNQPLAVLEQGSVADNTKRRFNERINLRSPHWVGQDTFISLRKTATTLY